MGAIFGATSRPFSVDLCQSWSKKNKPRVRVLFVCSNPTWTSRLDLGDEMRELLNGLQNQDVRLTLLPAAQRLDLKMAITNREFDVLHFSGHATREEGIILRDEDGMEDPVDGTELENLLTKHEKPIKLVVLNACNTNPTAEKIRGSVDAIISTNKELLDNSARKMTRYLYKELSEGKTIDEAYATARLALKGAGLDESAYDDLTGDGGGRKIFEKPAEGEESEAGDEGGAKGPVIEGKAAYDKFFFLNYIDAQIDDLTRLIRHTRQWFWGLFGAGIVVLGWLLLRPGGTWDAFLEFIKISILGQELYKGYVDRYISKPHLDTMLAIGAAIPVILTFFQNRLSVHGNGELNSLQKMRELAKSSDQLPPELQERLQKIIDECIRGADTSYKPFFWDVIIEKLQPIVKSQGGKKDQPSKT